MISCVLNNTKFIKMECDKITMTSEEIINDYTRLKLEYTRLHEDYRRLITPKQLTIPVVSQQRELFLGFQKSEWFYLYEQGVLEYKDAIEKYLA